MKLLVTGGSGLVGSYIVSGYPHKETLIAPTSFELDVTRGEKL